jgi:hypothetical protein
MTPSPGPWLRWEGTESRSLEMRYRRCRVSFPQERYPRIAKIRDRAPEESEQTANPGIGRATSNA